MRFWENNIKKMLLALLVAFTFISQAQEDRLNRAQQLYRTKATQEAMVCIDSVVKDPQTKKDFVAWTNRAYIYFDAYKVKDKQKLNSALRDTIISSLKMSAFLQPDSGFAMNNRKLLMNLSANYFNIAKSLLQDSLNAERSAIAYTRFRDLYKLAEPAVDLKSRDIEYYLAVGSVFSGLANKDNNDTKSLNTAKVALLKVFELQPDNGPANINMGLMYYNQAANLSKSLEYGADFSQIDIVQDNMVKLAKQAEQFIFKAYSADNKNLKAVEALYYIYRMLSENAKSDEFKKKGEELGIKFGADENLNNSNEKKDK